MTKSVTFTMGNATSSVSFIFIATTKVLAGYERYGVQAITVDRRTRNGPIRLRQLAFYPCVLPMLNLDRFVDGITDAAIRLGIKAQSSKAQLGIRRSLESVVSHVYGVIQADGEKLLKSGVM